MAVMAWGTPVQYRKIKSLTPTQFQTSQSEVGKIYTVVSSYSRISLMSQTVSREQFDKMVKEVSAKLAGKARLLSAKIDSVAKTFTYQYTPIMGFPLPVLAWLSWQAIVIIVAVVLLITLAIIGVDVGDFVAKSVTAPIVGGITNILTSPWVIGGLLVAGGGYYLLKNPSKIGEIRREIYAR
ncbi:MAG: hypothetical protein PHU34_11300 [Candidatus Methanoperedens sp.]|nr:hypothetical protein [Candidatus Methanoperedens sp.]